MCEIEALLGKFKKSVEPEFTGGGKGFDDLPELWL